MALTTQEEALIRQLLNQQAAILSLAGNEATITSKLGATKVTLADLVTASALADADLLLTRQGTNDKSVTASVLAQYMLAELNLASYAPLASPTFTGDPKAPTPAQFDKDTSLATTAFVRSAIGSYSDRSPSINGAVTLTGADAGSRLELGAGAELTFPLCSSVPIGTAFLVTTSPAVSNAKVIAQAPDSFALNNAGAFPNHTLGAGTDIVFINSGSEWRGQLGTELLRTSNLLTGGLGSTGYQKLPSGLIIQWGLSGASNAGVNNTVTLPIAFPSNHFQTIVAGINSGITGSGATNAYLPAFISRTLSNFVWQPINGACLVSWIAFGN